MTTAMKAAFTLTLEDKLSSGLKNIQQAFQQLRDRGKELTLGKLERGGDILRTVAREVRDLTSDLRRIEAVADRGWASLKRMASVRFQSARNWGEQNFGPKSRLGGAAGGIAAVAGGVSLLAPVKAFADLEWSARHSAITQGLSGAAANVETKRLMTLFNKDALETGQSAMSIAQAYQDLLQTGLKPEQVEKLLPIHSRAATAYNITPESLGHAVFALSDSFKVDETGMGGALAAMALASKEGRFKVEDFSQFLPKIGGNMAKLGMTGRGSANLAFAALETVMKNAGAPGEGATNFNDFMNYLTSPHAARSFGLESKGMAHETKAILAKYHVTGINLPRLLENAREQGVDPITAVLGTLQKKTAGLPPDVLGEVLGAFFTNEQSRDAAQSLLKHPGEFLEMKARLAQVDAGLLGRDFDTAHASPHIMLDTGKEAGAQLERRAGEGLDPIIARLTSGLERVVGGVDTLDKKLPGLGDAVIGVTGSVVLLTTALGAIGFVAPAVSAGFTVMSATISGVIGFLGALGVSASALSLALPALVIGAITKLGSDAETPANRDAIEKLHKEMRSLDGGPNGALHDGFDVWGRPIPTLPELPLKLPAPSSTNFESPAAVDGTPGAPLPPPRSELDITIHTEPGTTATINRATDGVNLKTPNPGANTNVP